MAGVEEGFFVCASPKLTCQFGLWRWMDHEEPRLRRRFQRARPFTYVL